MIAIGRKNYLFAGSDAGGRRAAALYSLIETAKLSSLDPQKYLADVLARIADHPARQIADLLPWHWKPVEPTAPPRDPASSPSGYGTGGCGTLTSRPPDSPRRLLQKSNRPCGKSD